MILSNDTQLFVRGLAFSEGSRFVGSPLSSTVVRLETIESQRLQDVGPRE